MNSYTDLNIHDNHSVITHADLTHCPLDKDFNEIFDK